MGGRAESRQLGPEREPRLAANRDASQVLSEDVVGLEALRGVSALDDPRHDGDPSSPRLMATHGHANDAMRIQVLRQLQRTRGNAYVQRLLARTTFGGEAWPASLPEPVAPRPSRDVQRVFVSHSIQRQPVGVQGADDLTPDPVEVTWAGDRFKVGFERDSGQPETFNFVVQYLGALPAQADGTRTRSPLVRLPLAIDPTLKLRARIRARDDSSILLYLYGDSGRMAKLVDTVEVTSGTARGRRHSIEAQMNGVPEQSPHSISVLDPRAQVGQTPATRSGASPGATPVAETSSVDGATEILLDGDGDQYKELLVRLKISLPRPDVPTAPLPPNAAGKTKFEMVQVSTGEKLAHDFGLPSGASSAVAIIPVVKDVTDGKAPTRISLFVPEESLPLEIRPPAPATGGGYSVAAAGETVTLAFKQPDPLHRVATLDPAKVFGGILSWDLSLGAYEDRFRLTILATGADKATLGISALRWGQPVDTQGAELKIVSPIRYTVIQTSPVSFGLDLNGDGKPDLEVFDQLTEPDAANGGGPVERNRDHRLRVLGSAIGGERFFQFHVRQGFAQNGNPSPSGVDQLAESQAMAVAGLEAEAKGGAFQDRLDQTEAALVAIRQQAADTGAIGQPTFLAWKALSAAMIKLRPQTKAGVDAGLQGGAATQAEALYKALAVETAWTNRIKVSQVGSSWSNPYTGEETAHIAGMGTRVTGYGPQLAGEIRAGQWDKAYADYDQLVDGLDRWAVEQLKVKRGEARGAEQTLGMKQQLSAIAAHNPQRILAVYHPDEKFKTETGYVAEVPLELYYWREGDTWHLKDLTNPSTTYEYRADAVTGGLEPPVELLLKLNDPDHFPAGVIHYEVPGKYASTVKVIDSLTWKKFLTYLGLTLAAVGLALSLGPESVAVYGTWALGASALTGALAAGVDLAEHIQQGNLDATTAVLDLAQIAAGMAGATSLASGSIVRAAANAPAGARFAGAWARTAMLAQKVYIPATIATGLTDAVTFLVVLGGIPKQLEDIEKGNGTAADKARAKLQLLSQLAVLGGLSVLSAKGTLAELGGGKTLVLHPGPDGVPVVSTALQKNTVVIDTQTAVALDKRARGLSLQPGEQQMVKAIDAMGDVDLRVADRTVTERAAKGATVPQQGIGITVDRSSQEYQDVLKVLETNRVGKAKGVADREIVADLFFTAAEPGVTPTLATHDPGIYNNMARIKCPERPSGYEPAKSKPVPTEFPTGFDTTVNGKTIKVIPLK